MKYIINVILFSIYYINLHTLMLIYKKYNFNYNFNSYNSYNSYCYYKYSLIYSCID